MQQQIFMESGSSIGTFMDCPKLYEYRYIKRLSSGLYQHNLGYGSFIHALIEMIHKGEMSKLTGSMTSQCLFQEQDSILRHLLLKPLEKPENSSIVSHLKHQLTSILPQMGLMHSQNESQALSTTQFLATSGIPLFMELGRYILNHPKQVEEILLDAALALGVVNHWHDHWYLKRSPKDDLGPHQAQVILSEREWQFQLRTCRSDIHVGKSDGVIDHKTYEKKFLYELKTSGDPDRNSYKHKLELDKQINSNLIAMQKDGFEPAGVLYDIIWKPAIRLKKDRKNSPDETKEEFYERILECYKDEPEKYFERLMVFRSQSDINEYMLDLDGQYDAIHRASERGHYYRNTNSCEKFGRLCQFFNACMSGQSEEESHFVSRDKKLPEISSELQNEINKN